MNFFYLPAFISLAAAGVLNRRDCSLDNCLSVVNDTADGDSIFSSRLEDCSSYLIVTVYEALKTVYPWLTTTTIISQVGDDLPPSISIPPSTILPTSVPAYASASCASNGTAVIQQYASACSCLGVVGSTTTIAPEIIIGFTGTVTQTIESFAVSAYPVTTADSSAIVTGYLAVSSGEAAEGVDSEVAIIVDETSDTSPLYFKLNENQLQIEIDGVDLLASQDVNGDGPIAFNTNDTIVANNYSRIYWTPSIATSSLTALSNGRAWSQSCDGGDTDGALDLTANEGGVDILGRNCTPIDLSLVF